MGIDRTITPETYISQSMKISREFQAIQTKYSKKMQKLNERFVKIYSQYKKDQVIDLPEGVKEGYDKFRIEEVVPNLTPKGKGEIHITYKLNGFFTCSTGEQEDLKGTIIPQSKQKEDELNEAKEV